MRNAKDAALELYMRQSHELRELSRVVTIPRTNLVFIETGFEEISNKSILQDDCRCQCAECRRPRPPLTCVWISLPNSFHCQC
jgi:hypothetical protein